MSSSHINNGFAPPPLPASPHVSDPTQALMTQSLLATTSTIPCSTETDLFSINDSYYNNLYSPTLTTNEEIRCINPSVVTPYQTYLTVQDVNLFINDIMENSMECQHQQYQQEINNEYGEMNLGEEDTRMTEVIEDESIYCPASLVACLIGKGGKTISYIQDKSKTNIQIERSISAIRKVNIRGKSNEDVGKAKEMVYSILGSGSTDLYYSNNQSYQFGITRALECPKILIGRVIGKQGRTMRMLESIYSIKISVFQGGDPCTINIFGTQTSVNRVTDAISQLVEGLNPIDVVSKSFNLNNNSSIEKNIW